MSLEFHVDPDLWAVFKAVTHQKDKLADENAALRARIAELEEQARLMPFWRRRAKHAMKQLEGKGVLFQQEIPEWVKP